MIKYIKRHMTRIRIAIGLTSITVTFMLIASFLNILPDYEAERLNAKMRLAQVIASNGTLLVSQGDVRRMQAVMSDIVTKDETIERALIKTSNGKTISSVGEEDFDGQWSKVEVPVWSGDKEWGKVELHFKREIKNVFQKFLTDPLMQYILLVSSLSFIVFFLYLGRMLKVLDPSQAIPDRVRSALDTMAEGLLVIDAKNNIVLANKAFSALVDRPQSVLVGMNCSIFNWKDMEDAPLAISDSPWALALNKKRIVTGKRIKLFLETGEVRTFMVNCSPVMSDNDKVGGVLVSFDDVTALEEKERELIFSKEQADRANKSKSDFLANMSHEIRTPMTAIMGFSEVLRRGYGESNRSIEYLDTITKNSNHLLELINDILDLSKVESGQIEVEKSPTKLYEIISDVCEVLQISATTKGVALIYVPQNDMPEEIETDPSRIRQVITNLIGNAIKFTQRGSITVESIWDEDNKQVVVKVVDTGIGMTESQQTQIFSPFMQADSSITRRFGGTGLGLTISKRYAEALGGDIEVSSRLGKGSCFTLYINAGKANTKIMIPPEDQKRTSGLLSDEMYVWDMPEASILVVDDCEENRELIEVLLDNQGLKVEKVDSGLLAVERVTHNVYDLVLMDVQMPGMDGYTAVARIRELGIETPIIALTAHAMKGIEKKCIGAGFTGYVAKPIKIDVLLAKVAECVGGTQSKKVKIETQGILQNSVDNSSDDLGWKSGDVIVSALQENEKYIPIISKFVDRFDDQIKELYKFKDQENFDGLEELAHKLKGSTGTVGYYEFTEPFQRLEKAASVTDKNRIAENLQFIRDMAQCIDRSKLELPQQKGPGSGKFSSIDKKAM